MRPGPCNLSAARPSEWNIDKTRIGAIGGSAGACSSLWLAFHDDMADPKSSDPIARESTRLTCAAVNVAQTSLDPKQMKEWTPNSNYGGHAFGFTGDSKKRPVAIPAVPPGARQDPAVDQGILTLRTGHGGRSADLPQLRPPPALGQEQKDPTHTANFGVKLQEKCRSVGVECHLAYPGAADLKYHSVSEFLIAKLKGKGTEKK